MPVFDFECPVCGKRRLDTYVVNKTVPVLCEVDESHGPMITLPCTPAFVVRGFSAKNLYAGGQRKEIKVKEKNMKVYVDS